MKSMINVANPTVGTDISIGGTYQPTVVRHRFCKALSMVADGVQINKAGGYVIEAVANVSATAVGDVKATLLQDGRTIASTTVTATAIGDKVALPLTAAVTVKCGCVGSVISVVIGEQAVESVELNMTVQEV